ncbi:MAG: hypothetical protein C4317_07910 [Acidimicrobiia bacterium]
MSSGYVVLEELRLKNFRNYVSESVYLGEGLFFLEGPNGAGKTNFVEAIYVLGSGRSWRPGGYSAMIGTGAEAAGVAGTVSRMGAGTESCRREWRLAVEIRHGLSLAINGRAARWSQNTKIFPVVAFSPEDLFLVKGSAESRRDWLDSIGRGVFPGYAGRKTRFERALKQRNKMLREARERLNSLGGAQSLEVWNEEFAKCAAELVCKRLNVYQRVRPLLEEALDFLGIGSTARITYLARLEKLLPADTWEAALGGDTSLVEDEYKQALSKRLGDELRRGLSLVGPQRDDIEIQIDKLSAREGISQGQQRLVAIAMRLAEASLLETLSTTKPVLVLDDVFSELDHHRQRRVWQRIAPQQGFITSTSAERLDTGSLGIPMRVLRVRRGRVERERGALEGEGPESNIDAPE